MRRAVLRHNANCKEYLYYNTVFCKIQDAVQGRSCLSGALRSGMMDLQRFPVFFLLIFCCHTVIPVHPVLRRFAVGQEAPQGQAGIIQLRGVVGGLCHGNDVTRTEEQQHFVQRTADIVVSGGQDLFIVVVHSPQACP